MSKNKIVIICDRKKRYSFAITRFFDFDKDNMQEKTAPQKYAVLSVFR